MDRRAGGFALIQVTLLSVLGAVVALCALSQWIFQSQIDRLAVSRDGARRLSEAALNLTIAKLLKDPNLDGNTLPLVQVELPSYPEAIGYAALNSSQARSLAIPLSVNNLKGNLSVAGRDGNPVAAASACLVGVGRFRGREVRIEALLYRPAFPYVISSNLSVNAISGLKVFGVSTPGALEAGYDPASNPDKLPGHIATGALDQPGRKALQLQGVGTVIEGDAQASGSVQVDAPAQVNGSIRPQADAPGLPQIDINSLDTSSKPGNTPLTSNNLNAPNLSGFNSRNGDLQVQNGLKLSGGVLFVKGDLDIQGGVQGKGAIIATGSIHVAGGSSLSGDNQTAIVAGGSVSLQGSAPTSKSEFRGLVYSGGNLNCKYTNIAGAVVVNSPDSSGSVTLEEASLVESAPLAQINIDVQTSSYSSSSGRDPRLQSPQQIRGYASGNAFSGLVGPMLPVPSGGLQEVRTEFVWYPARGDGSDMQIPPGFRVTQTTPWVEIAPDPITDAAALGSVRQINVSPNDPVTGTTQFGQYQNGFYITGNNRELADEAGLRAAMADAFSQWFPGCSDANQRIDSYISDLHAQLPAYLQDVANCYNANSKLIATSPPGSVSLGTVTVSATASVPWKLDLGDFYNFADQVRIKSWLEL
ncbi:MAG: hypothetical protein U0931_04190 [Vulcanimicrobiota bacterium]